MKKTFKAIAAATIYLCAPQVQAIENPRLLIPATKPAISERDVCVAPTVDEKGLMILTRNKSPAAKQLQSLYAQHQQHLLADMIGQFRRCGGADFLQLQQRYYLMPPSFNFMP